MLEKQKITQLWSSLTGNLLGISCGADDFQSGCSPNVLLIILIFPCKLLPVVAICRQELEQRALGCKLGGEIAERQPWAASAGCWDTPGLQSEEEEEEEEAVPSSVLSSPSCSLCPSALVLTGSFYWKVDGCGQSHSESQKWGKFKRNEAEMDVLSVWDVGPGSVLDWALSGGFACFAIGLIFISREHFYISVWIHFPLFSKSAAQVSICIAVLLISCLIFATAFIELCLHGCGTFHQLPLTLLGILSWDLQKPFV